MFRFHIQGLCIAVRTQSRLRVLMLNSAARQTSVPFHIQSVFAPRASVNFRRTTYARLPSIEGRWLTTKSDRKFVGWSVTGLRGECGRGRRAPKRSESTLKASHPVPVTRPDWSDLHWVLNAARMLPSGKLKKAFTRLGPATSTIVEFRGGRLEGGSPVDDKGSQFIWFIRPGYQQAITDTLDVVFDGPPPKLRFVDTKSNAVGNIVFKKKGEAWIINDATELDAQAALMRTGRNQKKKRPSADDAKLYLEAFDAPKVEKDAVEVRSVKNFVSKDIFEGPHCALLLVG